jgi:hypothetical protein
LNGTAPCDGLQDGTSNWLKGMTLILAYLVIAGSFFYHKVRAYRLE